MKTPYAILPIVLALASFAGCAGPRETQQTTSPVAGTWSFTLATPEGSYGGTLTLIEEAKGYSGQFQIDESNEAVTIENIQFEGDRLTFDAHTRRGGHSKVNVVVDGDTFVGTWDNITHSVPGMAIKGKREG